MQKSIYSGQGSHPSFGNIAPFCYLALPLLTPFYHDEPIFAPFWGACRGDFGIIEPLLDSISQDCMGQTLLAALDGVTIKIHGYDPINNYNSFNPENNIIHLERHKTYGIRDYVLLEELIHCYQVQQQGYLSIGKQLNNEIEAKAGWLLARKRNKKPSNTNAIVNAFYNQETLNAMYSLSDHFIAGSNPSSQDYKKVYIAAINGLRKLPGYSNITISHLDADWQFDVLTILMANCPELNN